MLNYEPISVTFNMHSSKLCCKLKVISSPTKFYREIFHHFWNKKKFSEIIISDFLFLFSLFSFLFSQLSAYIQQRRELKLLGLSFGRKSSTKVLRQPKKIVIEQQLFPSLFSDEIDCDWVCSSNHCSLLYSIALDKKCTQLTTDIDLSVVITKEYPNNYYSYENRRRIR